MKIADELIPERITITRTQLCGFGTSRYLARQLTLTLTPVRRCGRQCHYALPDVMSAISEYLAKPRIRATTRQTLEHVFAELRPQADNTLSIPFGNTEDLELRRLCLNAMRSKVSFDRQLSEAKAALASIRGRDPSV